MRVFPTKNDVFIADFYYRFFTAIIIILPFLQGMGKQCPGQAEARFPCNTQPCNIQWGEWGPCSESCNRGIQTAWTECQANKGSVALIYFRTLQK